MARSSEADTQRSAYECAWHASLGMDVDEIAAHTSRSRPSVYRSLEYARRLGWLDDSPRLTMPMSQERDNMEAFIRDKFKAEAVADLFARDVRPARIIVVPAPPRDRSQRLDGYICRVLRHSQLHRDVSSGSRSPDWSGVTGALAAEAAADEDVASLSPTPDEIVQSLTKFLGRPYTARDYVRSKRVGKAAATLFAERLTAEQLPSAGISWGFHLRSFARTLRLEFAPFFGARDDELDPTDHIANFLLFPVIGSLGVDQDTDIREKATECGANANCAEIAQQIGAPRPVMLTQPAHIPLPFSSDPSERRRIWEYVQADSSVRLVFGAGLADRRVTPDTGAAVPDPIERLGDFAATLAPVDSYLARSSTLVTGIGSCTWDSRAPRLGIVSNEELEALAAAGAVGDISGQFFWPRNAVISENQKAFIRDMNARFISPRLGDFAAATARHRENPEIGLGTTILASGKRKASAVRAACEHGIVATLVIDSDLADALTRGG